MAAPAAVTAAAAAAAAAAAGEEGAAAAAAAAALLDGFISHIRSTNIAKHWPDLAAAAGRPAQLLLQQLLQLGPSSSSSSSSEEQLRRLCQLSALLADMCWEKLHTGHWADVAVAWRDCYSCACLLQALAGVCHHQQQQQQQVAASLRQLDLAAMMGGPRFRSWVDRAASALEQQLRQQQQQEQQQQQRAAKRAKTASSSTAPPAVPLPPGSFSSPSTRLPTIPPPSIEHFALRYMPSSSSSSGQPVVLRGLISHWPAASRWQDPAYFIAAAGARTVPVEVGQHYLADGWGTQLMTVEAFVQQHLLQQQQQRGYLAQHALFDQLPALAADIAVPDYCCATGAGELVATNAWIGPAGTVTPLHTDPHHNLLAQVVGSKYVRLYAPQVSEAMYAFEEGATRNSSRVDLDAVDEARFPLFRGAAWVECVLGPGDVLYIPPGWWHYVKSLSFSCSVSFWWR